MSVRSRSRKDLGVNVQQTLLLGNLLFRFDPLTPWLLPEAKPQ